jgi:uncharacterized protein (TIGR02391 family)
MAGAQIVYRPAPNPHGLPPLAALEQLSATEVGLRILEIWSKSYQRNHLTDFVRSIATEAYTGPDALLAMDVLMEGATFLQREGLVIRDASQSGDFYKLSRTGLRVAKEGLGVVAFTRIETREMMHPIIAAEALPEMDRGPRHFPDAIFKAFKEVEIAVRARSGLERLYGVGLMREAFKAGGPLADPSLDAADTEAVAHLFAGAATRFKNAGSHRKVQPDDVRVTLQLLALASYLLTYLDRLPP